MNGISSGAAKPISTTASEFLSDQSGAVGDLHGLIAELEQRIEAALRDPVDGGASKLEPTPMPPSRLCAGIESNTQGVISANHRIAGLISRLTV